MGGWGSGRRKESRHKRKLTTEEAVCICVGEWHRSGKLEPGSSFLWGPHRSPRLRNMLDVLVQEQGLWIKHLWAGTKGPQWLALERTACTFGGARLWFVCPGCQGRAGKLYLTVRERRPGLLCRRCLNLGYSCQREDREQRQARKVKKLQAKLGGSAQTSLQMPLPDKPRGMHWRTYDRLAEAVIQTEMARLGSIRKGNQKLYASLPPETEL